MAPIRRPDSILFLGKLDEEEHPEVFVRALELLHEEGISFVADMVGSPSEPASIFAHKVRNRAATLALEGVLTMRDAVPEVQKRELFEDHAICVNLAPLVDESLIEQAKAHSVVPVVADESLRGMISDQLLVDAQSPESVTAGLKMALLMNDDQRTAMLSGLRVS